MAPNPRRTRQRDVRAGSRRRLDYARRGNRALAQGPHAEPRRLIASRTIVGRHSRHAATRQRAVRRLATSASAECLMRPITRRHPSSAGTACRDTSPPTPARAAGRRQPTAAGLSAGMRDAPTRPRSAVTAHPERSAFAAALPRSAPCSPSSPRAGPARRPASRPPRAAPPGARCPADYLSLYRQAGAMSGVPWSVLAAIGAIETDHGRSHAPRAHGPQTPVTGLSGARSARRPAGELIRAVQPSFRLLTLGRRGWRR